MIRVRSVCLVAALLSAAAASSGVHQGVPSASGSGVLLAQTPARLVNAQQDTGVALITTDSGVRPAAQGSVESSGFWARTDRFLTLAVAGIALIAVYLSYLTWSVTRAERQARERAETAAVINVADLIARRVEGVWKTDFGYALQWPGLHVFDRWLQEIEQDVSFAGTMQDRAANIDLKTVAHAEYVWQRFFEIRSALFMARITCHNNVEGRDTIPHQVQQVWKRDYRASLLVKCEEITGAIRRLESVFPEASRTVDGQPRSEHMRALAEEIAAAAGPEAKRHAEEVERRVTEDATPSF